MAEPAELTSLLIGLAGRLQHIQRNFDAYQQACFTARPPEFFALELNGEAGELGNLEKKAWKGVAISADRFDDEAADVLIALMNYCNARGVNIGAAVAAKLKTIERRRGTLAPN
ncbi:hypothetical protein BH09SUM1_BH09SUM1_08410 [soil metagenome]